MVKLWIDGDDGRNDVKACWLMFKSGSCTMVTSKMTNVYRFNVNGDTGLITPNH